jgi:acetyl-CoA carboxylase biotin carboxyl carrier protein
MSYSPSGSTVSVNWGRSRMPDGADNITGYESRPAGHETLRLFREEVSSLVKTIPGPMASLSLRVGECVLEVTWAPPSARASDPAVETVPTPAGEVVPIVDDGVRDVVSPMVGTFYVAPEPGAKPFVRQGDRVEAGQFIGIVEAMKLMNQIPTEWVGEVLEVLVKDGEPVEFDQPLVRLRLERE